MGLKWSEVEDSGGWSVFEGGAVKTITHLYAFEYRSVKPYILIYHICSYMSNHISLGIIHAIKWFVKLDICMNMPIIFQGFLSKYRNKF